MERDFKMFVECVTVLVGDEAICLAGCRIPGGKLASQIAEDSFSSLAAYFNSFSPFDKPRQGA